MNMKQVKALAEILRNSELTSIEYSEGDFKIKMERNITAPVAASVSVTPAAAAEKAEQQPVAVSETGGKTVKSPMVGVFYAAPSPDEEPYVTIGSKVKKGDVLCIIEAMKLMNEITAEYDGEIADICVKNGDVVDYGQVIFKIR